MTIGERIKNRRLELNLSQDEVAKKCGYKSRSSIQKIEASRDLPLRKVSVMAKALECSESYLMGWEDGEKTPAPDFMAEYGNIIEILSQCSDKEISAVASFIKALHS